VPDWAQIYAADKKQQYLSMSKEKLAEFALNTELKNIMYEGELQKLKKAKTEPVAAGSTPTKSPSTLETQRLKFHDTIVQDPVVKKVIKDMEDLQKRLPVGLWWVVQ